MHDGVSLQRKKLSVEDQVLVLTFLTWTGITSGLSYHRLLIGMHFGLGVRWALPSPHFFLSYFLLFKPISHFTLCRRHAFKAPLFL